MTALILEDEARAVNHLKRLIRLAEPDMEITSVFETVREAVDYLKEHPSPDLIFSDVQLADGISFEVFARVQVSCPIIFTTAYDTYAIEAFNTNGIDYLLKPVEEERLKQALDKARKFSRSLQMEQLLDLQGQMEQNRFKSRFMVRVGEQIKSIGTEDILLFYSFQKATYLHTREHRNYILDYPLEELEQRLDPARYFRINRGYIVSIDACRRIYSWSNSRLKLEIEGIDDSEVVVARERVKSFKEWLDQ
jgi:DNA-binding LytR/AlgR family response regulator